MTVWVSKLALTVGVFSAKGEINGKRLRVIERGKIITYSGSEWHLTKDEADKRAENMRLTRIAYHQDEIKRLKRNSFADLAPKPLCRSPRTKGVAPIQQWN